MLQAFAKYKINLILLGKNKIQYAFLFLVLDISIRESGCFKKGQGREREQLDFKQ